MTKENGTANGKKFIGVHVDPDLHKLIKIRCTERNVKIGEAVIDALVKHLDLEEEAVDVKIAK